MVISQVVSILVNIMAHYLLIFVAELGVLGAGNAPVISWLSLGFASCTKDLGRVQLGVLNDWGQYVAFSILD